MAYYKPEELEQMRATLKQAKETPDDPRSKEIFNRISSGKMNFELKALGLPTVDVPRPKVDLQAAMRSVQMQNNPGQRTITPSDSMSTPPTVQEPIMSVPPQPREQMGVLGIDADFTGQGMRERFGDVKETFKGVINQMKTAGDDIREFATKEDRSFAERATMVGGRMFEGIAGVIGEAFIGAGKIALTQQAEDRIAEIVGNAAEGISETKLAQDLAGWYDGLDPRQQDQVRAAGGFAALLGELIGIRGTSVMARVGGDVVDTTVDAVQRAGRNADATAGVELDFPVSRIPEPEVPTADQATGMGSQDIINATRDAFRASDLKLQNRIQSAFDKGVKPNLGTQTTPGQVRQYQEAVQSAVRSIADNKENLVFRDPITGEEVAGRIPETLAEFRDALEQTKQGVYTQYNNLAVQAGDAGITVNAPDIALSLDGLINNEALRLSNPEAVRYAESVKERYAAAGSITPEVAQEIIKNYNNSLQAFYKNPTPEGLTRHAVDAYVVNNMRQQLDENIEAITGAQYQTLKNQYGALKTVERDVLRASLRDARKNNASLIDFTDIFTIGQLVGAVSNPGAVAGAGASYGLKSLYKYLNDPNTQVRRMFRAAEQLPPRETPPVTPQGQLPAGQGAGASIYTPIEVGGQTDRGVVTPGLTERVREGSIQQPTGERAPTVIEERLKQDQDAVAQAVSEMESDLTGQTRPSVGENFVQIPKGGAYRFNELPSWIPDEYRDADLMQRVMRNISEGRAPRTSSVREIELQKVVEDRVKARAEEIRNSDGNTGVFSGDAAFAAALMVGGTYFLVDENGELLPVVGMGAMMANPRARSAAMSQIKSHLNKLQKDIQVMENAGDVRSTKYKNKVQAYDDANQLLMQEERRSFNQPATAQTTDLVEQTTPNLANDIAKAKAEGKTFEEWVKGQGEPLYHGGNKVTDIKIGKDSFTGKPVGFSTTPDRSFAERYGKQISREGEITELYLKPNAKILDKTDAGIDPHIDPTYAADANLIKDAMAQGYDAVRMRVTAPGGLNEGTNIELQILNPDAIKTRSQLEDIWRQANSATDLVEQARNYETATDFSDAIAEQRGGIKLAERAELRKVWEEANPDKVKAKEAKLSEMAKRREERTVSSDVPNETTMREYGMTHRPSQTGATADDISKGGEVIPEDFYTNPEWYADLSSPTYQESWNALQKIKGKPEATVTIYRASPKNELNNGDWVTLSKKYAQQESLDESVKVHSFKVKAKDIQFAGDDINEFGYWPE